MNVLLGVTGGIAAYKSASLVSLLVKQGYNVDVVMTDAATKFVAPLTFETLSKNAVTTDTFSREKPFEVEHIALAKKANIAVIAPASANTIAKLACGIADNMLLTTFLALTCPVVVAPAMNTAMYENKATQVNLQILRDRGFYVMKPAVGELACGDSGAGRMNEPEEIAAYINEIVNKKMDFAGKRILISAGPTREKIDPVRYISNSSSGKMGYALAAVAKERGADVTLVSGPVSLAPHSGVHTVLVESAQQMYDAVMEQRQGKDVIVMCAAVSDYTPKKTYDVKLKKKEELVIEFTKTKDILAELGAQKSDIGNPCLVGFAAETNDVAEYAKAKLKTKNADMIVANDVSDEEIGFHSDDNAVSIYKKDGSVRHVEKDNKLGIAAAILDEISKVMK
ncbi:MAG: bifunctional phosphopantothenoylcysteine decarboxylase/phosphopantothenate--cysteine ligase CoaBC [Christensenellaceae bacterium]|jgi:phosphopantothenoylcysteine decarboxylase/phosphopantothenate--cysteine ligase